MGFRDLDRVWGIRVWGLGIRVRARDLVIRVRVRVRVWG